MSTIQLSPYINFQGRAREAMEFYHQLLGGTLDLIAVNAQGVAGPAVPGDRITHGRLVADGTVIIAGDGHPSYLATVGDNLALALSGTDRDLITRIFDALADGGTLKMPLTVQSGGAAVGWLTDRFGINWMVQVEPA